MELSLKPASHEANYVLGTQMTRNFPSEVCQVVEKKKMLRKGIHSRPPTHETNQAQERVRRKTSPLREYCLPAAKG